MSIGRNKEDLLIANTYEMIQDMKWSSYKCESHRKNDSQFTVSLSSNFDKKKMILTICARYLQWSKTWFRKCDFVFQ